MSAVGLSLQFGAMRNLIAIGYSGSVPSAALGHPYPTGDFQKRLGCPARLAEVERTAICSARSPRSSGDVCPTALGRHRYGTMALRQNRSVTV